VRVVRSISDWEAELGAQIRATRLLREFTQADLAAKANVAVGAVAGLEQGRGSTLRTLISIVRVLDRTDWLESLAPPIRVSPMQALRDQRRTKQRQRVYVRRTQAGK
jgi:transcriptional regulator with XRE-family HTH domain